MQTLEKMNFLKETQIYLDIKNDLIKQLQLKNAATPTFLNQVEDYMNMWVNKELLIEDVETRGIFISYQNGANQSGTRKNDSITDQIKINLQMLKLLDSLDILSTTLISEDDDVL